MNATMQTSQSMTASAAILNAQTYAAKAKTPHTHSALSSTINIQERVAAAEKAIKNKFLLLVEIWRVEVENGKLSIIFRDLLKDRVIEATSTDWKHLKFYDCDKQQPLKIK
ncbi:MAG: hypothetical protein U0L68_06420 [Prevotellamassilia sp.]|nr:hypothetical protein [Prevotellamassilia sp.]